MSGTASPTVVFDVMVLVVFVAFVIALGFLIVKFRQARYARAWKPLLGVVQGVVLPSTGGGADSRIRGSYKGHDIFAAMAPQASKGEDSRYNHFEVGIIGLQGALDWKIAHVRRLLPSGSTPDRRLETKDEALRSRLEAAGIVRIVEALGIMPDAPDPPASYSMAQGILRIQCDCGPEWIPSEAFFVEMIETLIALARINAECNAGPDSG